MKPLILSFFAILLIYSLFIDNDRKEVKPVVKKTVENQLKQTGAIAKQNSDSIASYFDRSEQNIN